jgi:hypothetical protein
VRMESKRLAMFPVQTDGSFPNVLADYICMHGAPTKLFSDNACAEMSNKTKAILRNFGIAEGYSELHYQYQNAGEREIQDVKKDATMAMNLTNTPYAYWPLCVEYIVMVKNHTARVVLRDHTPQEKQTGQTPDVSKLLQYCWWEPVYFLNEDGEEVCGRWAGVAEHVGDELTFVVVNDATGFAVFWSDLCTATDPNTPNLRAEAVAADSRKLAEELSPVHKSTGSMNVFSLDDAENNGEKVYPYAPEDLIGKVYLLEEKGHGEFVRAEVVWSLKQHNDETRRAIQFLVETGDGEDKVEHIVDYVMLCDIIEAQAATVEEAPTDAVYTFKSILAHQGPLTVKDTRYKGSSWNILIEWDGGETTWEPLNLIAKCDPISVALYGEENGLLMKKGVEISEKTRWEYSLYLHGGAQRPQSKRDSWPKV